MRPSVVPDSTTGRSATGSFAGDVEYYLTQTPRQLPSRYFYDALGSALFEAICELPWYGITRAEGRLLACRGREILARVDPLSTLIELGPGSGEKLATLIKSGAGESHHRSVDLSASLIRRRTASPARR